MGKKKQFRSTSVRAVGLALLIVFFGCLGGGAARAESRIKDIATFEGIRQNLLVGYGLVVGLDGTGDTLQNSPFTQNSLENMLERLGVNIRNASNINIKDVAAVMVTANLPAFARPGNRIDVAVSALGDASSLRGGTLLVTPLLAADGEVYAVGQGPLAIGGFSAQGQAASVTKGVPTSGRIAGGAIVERSVGFKLNSLKSVMISLRNPDLATAGRMADAINAKLGMPAARLLDPATVRLSVPADMRGNVAGLLREIEGIEIQPDNQARVVIDENDGIIVMGKDVRISTVAIAQGNLTVRITETPQVSQPLPFSPGPGVVPSITGAPGIPGIVGGGSQTVVVPRTQIKVSQGSKHRLAVLPASVSLDELVNGLNALGVGPRDMISILQAIKADGALQAQIVVR